jgi:VanZ family protein
VRRLAWYWLPPLAWAALIFSLSAMSRPPVPQVDLPQFDKLLHACEYGCFGALLCRAMAMGGRWLSPNAAFLLALVVGGLYGVTDEFHQSFVPERCADVWDVVADCVGSAIGAGAFRLLFLRRHRELPARPR